jgi:hypothetical protein
LEIAFAAKANIQIDAALHFGPLPRCEVEVLNLILGKKAPNRRKVEPNGWVPAQVIDVID